MNEAIHAILSCATVASGQTEREPLAGDKLTLAVFVLAEGRE